MASGRDTVIFDEEWAEWGRLWIWFEMWALERLEMYGLINDRNRAGKVSTSQQPKKPSKTWL